MESILNAKAITFTVRAVCEHDLDAIMRIQAECYPPSMQEPEEVVLSRIRTAADTSFVAIDGDVVSAYVFGYPSRLGAAAPLNSRFVVPANANTLYIHDLAVSRAGSGLARRLVARIVERATERGLANCALVSVQDSLAFWERFGFQTEPAPGPELRAALESYPGNALYMIRSLDA
ncbi:GNAT family N-acetyltransferase [Massilia horti]|uniref:GNAT family N-acetyltransferase n=1 Tax=Massilia horti TaxID=2562153 RepID=UPI001431DDA6|nr:GNAT family N-acetyltransferase [Massilia horti]